MTNEDIIRMAHEAGLWPAVTDSFLKELQEFAALVAAAEREACAKELEKISNAPDIQAYAAAIRARGQS
jgi:hypothetical protein